jgi:DNA-binding beta-propeller fold protein YncE
MKTQLFLPPGRVSVLILALLGFLTLPFSAAAATCTSSNFTTDPTAYAATSPNLVTVLDAITNVTCTIVVGSTSTSGPTNLALTPDGTQLIVENDAEASVSVVDLSTGAVTNVSLTTSGITAPMTANLAVSPDGTFVYVVSLPQTLTSTTQASLNVISLPSLTVSAAISVVASPATPVTGPGLGISFLPDASKAYIATEGLTYIVTGGTSPTVSSTTIPVNGGTAAVGPAGDIAYVVDVASTANTVSQITTATNAFANLNPTPQCSQANTTAITPDGTLAYYTCPGSSFVQAIATSTNTVSATVNLASTPGPQGVAITSDGASAYVANNNGSISVITISGNTVATPITGASAFRGIGFRPVQLSINPTAQSVPTGATFQFTSTLKYAFGGVTWSVSCTAGGTACGIVNSSGLYTAPSAIPSPNDVKVIVTSNEIPRKSIVYPSQSVTAAVTVTPSKLAFTNTAVTVAAAACSTGLTVQSQDSGGNPANPTSTETLTIMSSSAKGKFYSDNVCTTAITTTTISTSANSATFYYTDTKAGSPTITVTGSGSFIATGANSATQTETVTSGTATTVDVETAADGSGTLVPPQNVTSGSSVTGYSISRDGSGNFVANAVATWSLANTTGGVTGTDLVAAGDNKSATFTGHLVGTGSIHAVVSGLTSTDSGTLTVVAGQASKLAFTTQPANGTLGGNVTPLAAVGVSVEDTNGNLISGSSASITITSTPANVAGTTTVSAGSGVATFNNLTFTIAGTYSLTAASGALTSANSNPFTLTSNINVTITSTITSVLIEDFPAGTDTFAGKANNDPNNPSLGVTWKMVSCGAGALGLCGSINSGTGAYTPPNTVPYSGNTLTGNTFIVQATSVADPSKTITTGTITITSNITVPVPTPTTPAAGEVVFGAAASFSSTPTDSGTNPNVPKAVTWTVNCTAGGTVCGLLDSQGNYTAPFMPPSPATFTVTATSVADRAMSATIPLAQAITIVPDLLLTATPVNVPAGAASGQGAVNLFGPNNNNAGVFTASCTIQVSTGTFNGSCIPAPASSNSLNPANAASGQYPITVTLTPVSSATGPMYGPHRGPGPMNFHLYGLTGLAILMSLTAFGVVLFRMVKGILPRISHVYAFALLLLLVTGWMSACNQFSAPGNLPNLVVRQPSSGTLKITLTTTSSGFTTQTATVNFTVN